MQITRRRLIARLNAISHGYRTHEECLGECTYEAGGWHCHGCDARVPMNDIADSEPLTVAEADAILREFVPE